MTTPYNNAGKTIGRRHIRMQVGFVKGTALAALKLLHSRNAFPAA